MYNIKDFKEALQFFQNNLQYIVNNDKTNEKYINIYQIHIDSLVNFFNESEKYISELELDSMELTFELNKQRKETYKFVSLAVHLLCRASQIQKELIIYKPKHKVYSPLLKKYIYTN
jgi:hypothetical protein